MTVEASERARKGLDVFVTQAVMNSFATPGAPYDLVVDDEAALRKGAEVVMFTVSSYLFRVLLLIQFKSDVATRAHVAGLASVPVDDMAGERFLDSVTERGNLFCGALNQSLVRFYPHTGMSTPCMIKHTSLEHIAAVEPSYSRRFRCNLASHVTMHFTLMLCAQVDFDFSFEAHAGQANDTSGDMEMF